MAQRYYVLWDNKARSHQKQMEEIQKELKDGHTIVLGGIGTLTLIKDEHEAEQIQFILSPELRKLETRPVSTYLAAERTKCVHRLTPADVPPGMDPDDVALLCKNDPKCPRKKGGAK